MDNFRIEGWFPPSIIKSNIEDKTYAVCGSSWIEIPANATIEEVTKGWICTASVILPKIKPNFPKRQTKSSIAKLALSNFKS